MAVGLDHRSGVVVVTFAPHASNEYHEATHEGRNPHSADPTAPGQHLAGHQENRSTNNGHPADPVRCVLRSRKWGRLGWNETLSVVIIVKKVMVERIITRAVSTHGKFRSIGWIRHIIGGVVVFSRCRMSANKPVGQA